jgi:hypothetical protein
VHRRIRRNGVMVAKTCLYFVVVLWAVSSFTQM